MIAAAGRLSHTLAPLAHRTPERCSVTVPKVKWLLAVLQVPTILFLSAVFTYLERYIFCTLVKVNQLPVISTFRRMTLPVRV